MSITFPISPISHRTYLNHFTHLLKHLCNATVMENCRFRSCETGTVNESAHEFDSIWPGNYGTCGGV
nr:hypothetical protein BaRGS_002656 [Batillaria attramentaria]